MNIFAQYAQPVRSVMDYQADADKQALLRGQVDGQTRQNALASLVADQQRMTMADTSRRQNALRVAADAGRGMTPDAYASSLLANPDTMDAGVTLQKHLADTGKVTADTGKANAEAAAKLADTKYAATQHLADKIGMIRTPDDLVAYEQEGIALGVFPPQAQGRAIEKAQQLGGIEQWKAAAAQAAVPLVDRFKSEAEMARAKLQSDTSIKTTSMTNDTSRATNAATVGATLAGQRSVAQTATNALEQGERHFNTTKDASKWTYDSERGGQVNTQTGEFRPAVQGGVPIGPKASQPSEGERVAAGFASRMVEATPLLDKFEKSGRTGYTQAMAGGIPLIGAAARTAVMNPEQQQYRQAQEDWVRAKLRKESGAAIGIDEMDKEIATYFPQPGESQPVITQKQRARAIATEAMNKAAGRAAYTSAVPAAAPKKTASGATASNW